jgi:hypothetical protein
MRQPLGATQEQTGPSFDELIENERANSSEHGGRTVFGAAKPDH